MMARRRRRGLLTVHQVLWIRSLRLRRGGVRRGQITTRTIARVLGVSAACIRDARLGRTYPWVAP